MIKIRGAIILIFLALFTTSCGTFKESVNSGSEIELNTDNLNLFNGKYKRLSNTYLSSTTHYNDFNDLFKCFFLWKGKNLMNTNTIEKDFVELEVIDEKRIKVSFIMNGKIEKSKILKGKLIENTFVFNARDFLMPLLLINYGERHRTRISLSQNGSLNLDAFQIALANFLIFPWTSGDNVKHNLEFEKIKE